MSASSSPLSQQGRALDQVRTLLGEGLLTSEGRSTSASAACTRTLIELGAGYAAVMAEYAGRTADRWRPGETLHVHDEMMCLTRDIAGKTLFDLDVGEDPGGVHEATSRSLKLYRIAVLPLGSRVERR